MEKLFSFIKKYRFFLFNLTALGILTIFKPEIGIKSASISVYQVTQMLLIIPPVFLLLGLLDVWVPRETMVKYMGEKSGIKGMFLAFILGSFAAGPLYGAFPVASVFMKKGVKFTNLMIFIGAWSTTKIPMLMFEMRYLGMKFTLTRLAIDIPGIILIAFALNQILSKKEIEMIYEQAETSNT
ncbi:MAG: permease [Clostridia bacterium]|nr:permease [Anaerotignum sp.]NCC16126.1 permease [Clostridia bacterium]